MTTSTMNPTCTNTTTNCNVGTQIAFNNITEPGCYVCNATGHLVRVNDTISSNTNGMNECCSWTGNEPFWFTCVSNDPNCDTNECRKNASNAGVTCCF